MTRDNLQHIFEAPPGQSVVVRASPGAGKTYLIAQRIAHLVKSGLRKNSRIACITYTNTGVEEIERELVPRHFSSMPQELVAGTIHSFLIGHILLPYGHFLPDLPELFHLTPPNGYAAWFCPPALAKKLPTYRMSLFESIGYDLDGTLACYRAGARDPLTNGQMHAFKRQMHSRGYIDLHDVLYYSLRILRDFPFVLDCLAARFASILVDEFQDTTATQFAILDLFLDSGTTSLFLVGDPDQSIFSFAGAVPQTFDRCLTDNRFYCPICGGIEHRLMENRRSSRKIVDFLNDLSSCPGAQTSVADSKDFPEPVRLLVGSGKHCPNGAAGVSDFYDLALHYFFDFMRQCGIPLDEDASFCVLAHRNSIVATLQATCLHGAPTAPSGLDRLKRSNPSLYSILHDCLIAARHKQEGEWTPAYEAVDRVLARLLFKTATSKFVNFDDSVVCLDRRAWPVVVWRVVDGLTVRDTDSLRDWCRTLKGLIDQAVALAGGKPVRQKRLGILDCRGQVGKVADSCTVGAAIRAVVRPTLLGNNFRTIHSAKGIQREAVLVVAKDQAEFERWVMCPNPCMHEIGRVGYVACSRARKILCLCCKTVPASMASILEARGLDVVPL